MMSRHAMTTVPVKPELIQWAVDRSGRSTDALSVRFPVREWLSGASVPTMSELEDFAKATFTPFGLLLLDTPPDERMPIPHYRTVSGGTVRRPSADLLETVYMME